MIGEKGTGSQHAEHVSEVGTRAHPDVLEDVGEDLPSFDHSPFEHHQILFQQDQVRRLLGDVGGRIDGDADVGGTQRGSIVDAVAHESDDMALGPEDADDSLLVSGGEPGEERRFLRRVGQFVVGHFLHVCAQEHGIGSEAHVLAHFAADEVVVAGEDLYADAMFVKCVDGASGGVFGRIEKSDIAFEHEAAFVVL